MLFPWSERSGIRGFAQWIVIVPPKVLSPLAVRELIDETAAKESHVGLRTASPSPMVHHNPKAAMGPAEYREYQRFGVLEEDVRALTSALCNP